MASPGDDSRGEEEEEELGNLDKSIHGIIHYDDESGTSCESAMEPLMGGGGSPHQRRRRLDSSDRFPVCSIHNDTGGPPYLGLVETTKAVLWSSWINIFLLAVPVGIAASLLRLPPLVIFIVNGVAIIPLCNLLSFATQCIAADLGDTMGAFLNISFGNLIEVIMFILALRQDRTRVVREALVGSILINLFLVLGSALVIAAIKAPEPYFDIKQAQALACLLSLSVFSILIPIAFHYSIQNQKDARHAVSMMSRISSLALLVMYLIYLYYLLSPHKQKPKGLPIHNTEEGIGGGLDAVARCQNQITSGLPSHGDDVEDDDDEHDKPRRAVLVGEAKVHNVFSILLLIMSTVIVALCSNAVVDNIKPATEKSGISETFIGLVLLPVAGNAAEYITAVAVADQGKMDLALGVSFGSSIQVALFVSPLMVIVGWVMGKEDMSLFFGLFDTVALIGAALVVNVLIANGKTNYLEGCLLCACYFMVAVGAFLST